MVRSIPTPPGIRAAIQQLRDAPRVEQEDYGLCWLVEEGDEPTIVTLVNYDDDDDDDDGFVIVYTQPMCFKDEHGNVVTGECSTVPLTRLIPFDAHIPDVLVFTNSRLLQALVM